MKSSQIFPLLVLFVVLAGSAYLLLNLNNQVQQKSTELAGYSIVKAELENNIQSFSNNLSNCQTQLTQIQQTYQHLLKAKQTNLTNPSFEDLVAFLNIDETEKKKYNQQNYDCTGFSLNLYKNSRMYGFNSGIAEIEFTESSNAGHMLNVFDTPDKGRVFIDDTGTKGGDGEDKVGYVEIGKQYGTLPLKSIINTTQSIYCNITCKDLAKEIKYVELNPFDYAFFENTKQCVNLYNNCSRIFAIESTERADYTQEEQKELFAHLQELYLFLADKHISQLSGNVTIKEVQIYW